MHDFELKGVHLGDGAEEGHEVQPRCTLRRPAPCFGKIQLAGVLPCRPVPYGPFIDDIPGRLPVNLEIDVIDACGLDRKTTERPLAVNGLLLGRSHSEDVIRRLLVIQIGRTPIEGPARIDRIISCDVDIDRRHQTRLASSSRP